VGLLLGGALWAASATALAGSVGVGLGRWWIAVAVVLVAVLRGVRSGGTGRFAPGPRARQLLLTGAATLVLGSAVVAWRVLPLVDGPLTPFVGSRVVLTGELLVSSDPSPRQGRTSGSRRTDDEWQLDGALVSMAVSGQATRAVDLPVRVVTSGDVTSVLPGTLLRVSGRVLAADPLRGRAATLVAESVSVLTGPPLVQGAAGAVRASLRAAVRDRPPDQAGLLPGLVVGDTSGVRADLDDAMRDSSLTHLVAVSGETGSL